MLQMFRKLRPSKVQNLVFTDPNIGLSSCFTPISRLTRVTVDFNHKLIKKQCCKIKKRDQKLKKRLLSECFTPFPFKNHTGRKILLQYSGPRKRKKSLIKMFLGQ